MLGDARSKPFLTTFRDQTIRKLARLILVNTFLPLAVTAWITTKSWTMVVLAFWFMPAVCLLQSVVGLISFRVIILSKAPPIPVTPRHGVVVVHPEDKQQNHDERQPHQTDPIKDSSSLPRDDDWIHIKYEETTLKLEEAAFLDKAEQQEPLRLLLIGDSSAIGVGQGIWPTPILPETVAKTLSRKMGGRPVYWTCHGTTGASIGWIIRELDRGVKYLHTNQKISAKNSVSPFEVGGRVSSTCSSETDESSLGDSSSDGDNFEDRRSVLADGGAQTVERKQRISKWMSNLFRHRERFDPELSDSYDIVIIMTGLNDAKSALLPFLLNGEDGELRKQAKSRGSCFYRDLHLLLDTMARKMKTNQAESDESRSKRQPLIVFPGLPTRLMPVFQNIPCTWYGGPPLSFYAASALDILDAHKHDVACAYPEDIIFFPTPNKLQTQEYHSRIGPHAELRKTENTVLSIRDLDSQESWEQQQLFQQFTSKAGANAYSTSPFFSIRKWLGFPLPPYYEVACPDTVHANELGYDFFGRYVGCIVHNAWRKREARRAGVDKKND